MNAPDLSQLGRTWQQLVAAYADGELAENERSIVERWLQLHPELAAELDTQRRFAAGNRAFWDSVSPQLPADERWNAAFRDIVAGIGASPPLRSDSGSRLSRLRRNWPYLLAVPMLAGAAAILLALLPIWRPQPMVPNKGVSDNSESAYSVASPQDVEIVSVRPADWSHVVVGEPLLGEKVTFVSTADVNIQELQPDSDGMTPRLQSGPNSGMPMVIAPLSRIP
ncbi:MAG TPA: hypothetical protein VGZ47_18420 [Gemmataceae bacterium]|jgi:anti-sigma factor RsiW|nr:hypothetical protein [Gemmataceae bacterium]